MTVSKPETVEVTQAETDMLEQLSWLTYIFDETGPNPLAVTLLKRHRLNATPSREALEMARPYVEGSHDDGCEMHFEYGEENFDDDDGTRFWPEDRKCTCGHDDVLASIDAALSDTPPPDNEALRGWQPIETCPPDEMFIGAVEVTDNRTGATWWERHLLALDDETGDIHADHEQGWQLADYSWWHPVDLPPVPTAFDNGGK